MKIIQIVIIALAVMACESNYQKAISASATASKNASGEVLVRDATQSEIDSLNQFHAKIQKINEMYPAPPTPINEETFAVRSISEDGVFILENNVRVKMSGLKCNPEAVQFIRKFFVEDSERLAYQKEKQLNNDIIEAYIWSVDSSIMKDPKMKNIITGPSFSGMNDIAMLNNWCEIDFESNSKYHSRYEELDKISKKKNR